jgi:transcriptional regulator with XRE-family HTH domain
MTASTLIRAARKSRRLTQQQLADRARIDQSRVSRSERGRDTDFGTVERLLAGAGHRLYSAPTQRDDAAAVAAEIRTRLADGNRELALRALLQLNDNLVAEHGLVRGVLGLAEPESTADRAWDAAIAALVAWRLREDELPVPAWVDDPSRYLSAPVALVIDPADPTPPLSEVPEEFARRGVLAWRDTFASV